MSGLHVDIVTPEKIVFSGSADEIRVPGVNGEFGVLPDHALFLSLLRGGILTVTGPQNRRFIIGRGFAEAGADRVVVLTDSCESTEGVDKTAAAALLAESDRVLADSAAESDERLVAERNAELARARLEA